jgi:hypothetical protein
MSNNRTLTLVITAAIALGFGYLVGNQTKKVNQIDDTSDISINMDFPSSSPAHVSIVDTTLAGEMIANFSRSCKDSTEAVLFDFATIFSTVAQGNPSVVWENAGFYAYFAKYSNSSTTNSGRNTIILKFVDGLNNTTGPTFIQDVGFLNMGDLCPNKCPQ